MEILGSVPYRQAMISDAVPCCGGIGSIPHLIQNDLHDKIAAVSQRPKQTHGYHSRKRLDMT